MRGKDFWNLVSFNENRNRRLASDELYKIKKANEEKLGRKSNHMGSSKRTHTTLPCSCCVGAEMSQKAGILGVNRIDIRGGKALFNAQCGYPGKVNCIYSNNLKDICVGTRLALARN